MVLLHCLRTTTQNKQPFDDLFSRTTWVSQHQKVKPIWILMKQGMIRWQWHLLDHTQIICISLQTDNHASNSSLSFVQFLMPSQQCQSTEGKKH